MKRSALLVAALALGYATGAQAQLTMQMSNGWTFSFAGNVNIFAMYQKVSDDGQIVGAPGGLVGIGGKGLYYGTGLLPAFATFSAKGKEGNTDLGIHFGFAPQVQCGGNAHDCFGPEAAGAQIDMRQVFLTVGGDWGQILAGRELGVFQRQNILNDQTLFGVGGGGIAPRGTTLGRIGFGYIYPNFVPQFTYSSKAGRPTQFTIGLFEPSVNGEFNELVTPRVEGEVTWKGGNILVFASGMLQNGKDVAADESKTAWGGAGGFTYRTGQFGVHASGYYGKGLGTTLLFLGGTDGADEFRDSYGYYGQLSYTAGKTTVAGSYGSSFLKSSDNEGDFKTENSMISGGLYYQATKSLKLVFEGDYMWTDEKEGNLDKNKAFTGAFGMMLFY